MNYDRAQFSKRVRNVTSAMNLMTKYILWMCVNLNMRLKPKTYANTLVAVPVNSINNAINVDVNAIHDKANRIQTIMIFFVSLNFAFTGFFFPSSTGFLIHSLCGILYESFEYYWLCTEKNHFE